MSNFSIHVILYISNTDFNLHNERGQLRNSKPFYRYIVFHLSLKTINFVKGTHCVFSSNLFHGQITQKFIDQLNARKTKNVALEKFLE